MRKLFPAITLVMLFSTECPSVLVAQNVSSKATGQDSGTVNKSQVDKSWIKRTERILDLGIAGPTNAEQKKELLKLRPNADDDPRYVFALVLLGMKEKQWERALENTKEILERNKDYIPAKVANARILLTLKETPAAVSELELLAKSLDHPSINVSSDQLMLAARFLGLAVGYLEGPGKESIKATALQPLIAETEKISQSYQGPFSQARLAVGKEYETLVEKGEKALKDLRKEKVEDAQEKRKELESQRAKAEAETEAARRQLESNWANAMASWNAAWSRCQHATQSSNPLVAQRGQLASSLASLRPPKVDNQGKVDRNDEQRYENEKQQYSFKISTLDDQLRRLSAQYELAQREGMVIENQMDVLRAKAQQLGMTFAAMNGSFAAADKSVRKKEKSTKKGEPKLSGSKLDQARAFTTYDDFNFHKEQTLLIQTLPKD